MTVAEYFVGMYLPWAKSRVRTKSYEGGPRDKSPITRGTYRGYRADRQAPHHPSIRPYQTCPTSSRTTVEQKLAEIPSLGSRRNAYKLLRQGYPGAVKWQLLQFVVTDAVEEPTADPVDKPTVKSAEMWDYMGRVRTSPETRTCAWPLPSGSASGSEGRRSLPSTRRRSTGPSTPGLPSAQ